MIDFSKDAQDALAKSKLQSRGAWPYVIKGDIEHAIPRLRSEWTSLPGAGQSDMSMATARKLFDQYVSELAGKKCGPSLACVLLPPSLFRCRRKGRHRRRPSRRFSLGIWNVVERSSPRERNIWTFPTAIAKCWRRRSN